MSANSGRRLQHHALHRGGAAGPSNSTKEKLTVSRVAPMRRPAFGQLGKPVQLEANLFQFKIPDNLRVFFYNVKFTRPMRDRMGRTSERDFTAKFSVERNRNTLECLRVRDKLFRHRPAFDGRRALFSVEDRSRHIGGEECYKIEVNEDGFDDTRAKRDENLTPVHVYINFVKVLDFTEFKSGNLSRSEASQFFGVLDIALAAAPLSNPDYVQVGGSFYSDIRTTPLTRRNAVASAWSGFYQSIRPTCNGLYVNVDFSCTAFWNGGRTPLMSLFTAFNPTLSRYGWPQDGREYSEYVRKLTGAFNGIKLKATHNQISYSLYGFSKFGAGEMMFTVDGRNISIAEYFASQYNCILQYPEWPCVKVQKKREVYIPIELLVVKPKQPYKGGIIGEAQHTMVQHATAEPRVVRATAQENIRTIDHGSNETCRSFGISVSDKLVEFRGRVLQAPLLQYENAGDGRKRVSVRNGSWTPSAEGRPFRFHRPGHIQEWGVLNMSKLSNHDVGRFADELACALVDAGFSNLKQPHFDRCYEDSVEQAMNRMCYRHQVSENSPHHRMSLLVVIKERQESRCYGAIKSAGDLGCGVVTQVCLARNCSNRSRNRSGYIANLILKINSKLGGVNCYPVPFEVGNPGTVADPEFTKSPFIVLGADVSHPQGGGPSVAAVVGSVDHLSYQFAAAVRNQKGRQEIITEMGSMFEKVYREWYHAEGGRFHAGAIIMFRDGVSEGQFSEVMEQEISSIREMCSRISQYFKPKITYILITKRHHVRLFPKGPNTGDRNGNIFPGTVVDTDVTSKEFYDFYLNSHTAIRGTSKPAKYTVLLDENNIPTDVLQAYIFRLTHSYCRTNTSVSMVHSAYYAHHLASRGRLYLQKTKDDGLRNGSGKRGRGGPHRNERYDRSQKKAPEIPPSPQIHPEHNRRLFFV